MASKQLTVTKWGNSLAVRLPSSTSSRYGLTVGTHLQLIEREGLFLMKPGRPKTPMTKEEADKRLRKLLRGVTAKNRHSEVDWGLPVGKEVW